MRTVSVLQSRSKLTLALDEGPVDEALWGKLGDLGTITALYFRYRAENVTQAPQTGYSNEAAAGTMYPDHWPTREAKNGNRPGAKFPTCAIENDVVPEKNLKGRAISHQAKYASRARLKSQC